MQILDIPVHQALELSCSAYRTNGRYIKESDAYFNNPTLSDTEIPNKIRILSAYNIVTWDNRAPPKPLVITDDDRDLAIQIKNFYKRLAFTVINDADNKSIFDETVFSLLNRKAMKSNDVGYLAYLPEKFYKESTINRVKRQAKKSDDGYLADIGNEVLDLDSEIIEVFKSKNYNAYNVTAIIENKMCSWMSNSQPTVGPAVIVKAKVKEHSRHYKYDNCVTRLHYVKVAQ